MTLAPKLIAHIIHRLDYGGLENGLVNLINRIPSDRYHHAIICMTEYSDFAERIKNPNVSLYQLHKEEGVSIKIFIKVWKLLREIKPDIVHTRNLSAIEAAPVAWLAGVRWRVHGEHGRDSNDIDGRNKKYLILRKICKPFIHRFIPLSKDLEKWLINLVMVSEEKIVQIYNGVDSKRFNVLTCGRKYLPEGFITRKGNYVIGAVGRIQQVKDQVTLVKAFAALISKDSDYRKDLRLVIVGDGPMMPELKSLIISLDLSDLIWLAGSRDDVPELMQSFDLFVLPSKAEGISNTILEAMSSGIPVIATDVGGNPELVVKGKTGSLIPACNEDAMASAIEYLFQNRDIGKSYGDAGRIRVETKFSMDSMVQSYLAVYDQLDC